LRPYGCGAEQGQALPSVYLDGGQLAPAGQFFTGARGEIVMVGIAIAMFIAVFGWGSRYFGWEDPDGKVQLALATCFILGVIGGYKAKS
jgi:hypothetical protein